MSRLLGSSLGKGGAEWKRRGTLASRGGRPRYETRRGRFVGYTLLGCSAARLLGCSASRTVSFAVFGASIFLLIFALLTSAVVEWPTSSSASSR